MHQRKQRQLQACLGLPGTQEDPVVSSIMAVAQQLPRTLLGLVWVDATSSSHFTEEKAEADPFIHFSRHSWSVHNVSAWGVLWQKRQKLCIEEENL